MVYYVFVGLLLVGCAVVFVLGILWIVREVRGKGAELQRKLYDSEDWKDAILRRAASREATALVWLTVKGELRARWRKVDGESVVYVVSDSEPGLGLDQYMATRDGKEIGQGPLTYCLRVCEVDAFGLRVAADTVIQSHVAERGQVAIETRSGILKFQPTDEPECPREGRM